MPRIFVRIIALPLISVLIWEPIAASTGERVGLSSRSIGTSTCRSPHGFLTQALASPSEAFQSGAPVQVSLNVDREAARRLGYSRKMNLFGFVLFVAGQNIVSYSFLAAIVFHWPLKFVLPGVLFGPFLFAPIALLFNRAMYGLFVWLHLHGSLHAEDKTARHQKVWNIFKNLMLETRKDPLLSVTLSRVSGFKEVEDLSEVWGGGLSSQREVLFTWLMVRYVTWSEYICIRRPTRLYFDDRLSEEGFWGKLDPQSIIPVVRHGQEGDFYHVYVEYELIKHLRFFPALLPFMWACSLIYNSRFLYGTIRHILMEYCLSEFDEPMLRKASGWRGAAHRIFYLTGRLIRVFVLEAPAGGNNTTFRFTEVSA
jgi:hypothetical protein